MLSDKLPQQRTELVVAPRHIEIVLADEGLSPLSIILPPLEDIAEMEGLRVVQYSLKEVASLHAEQMQSAFRGELAALTKKTERFHDAPTFFNRLANFAELSGERVREGEFLERMKELVDDQFVAHRIGDNLIARNLMEEAERFFQGRDLSNDVYANLRLAFFQVHRKDLERAAAFVEKAVTIDPLDFNARLFEGSLNLVRQRFQQAVQSFRFAAQERQTSSPLYANMAVAYMYLRRPDKALAALRKAVALDPWNENAVAMLADYGFVQGENADAVPSLRFYVAYEQKNAAMWARLARALLELGEVNEAIAALKRQGSIQDSSQVWNNLGVAYHKRHDRKKAYESFKHGVLLSAKAPGRDYFLAARNLVSMLAEDNEYKSVLEVAGSVLGDRRHREILLKDAAACDLYVFYAHALYHTGQNEEATKFCEYILTVEDAAPRLIVWVATALIGYYSLNGESRGRAIALAKRYEGLLERLSPADEQRREALINNIAFAYLEDGQLDAAEHYLQLLSYAIHEEPYPTATLGLLHLRRGHIDRGCALYEDALRIARGALDKARIRQKLNFELGCYYINADRPRAQRLLQKVRDSKNVPELAERADAIMRTLKAAE